MSKSLLNETAEADQTREYVLLAKVGEKFPRLRQTLLELFSIDLRTLALTRVTVATIVLIDLILRLPDLKAFYTDDGVMPRAAVYELQPHSWFFSLHFLNGRVEVAGLMFLISGIFALLLLIGCKTKLASFWSWLLFASLCVRNPFIVHGADSLLKMLLFWGLFVPWGARFSVDSALNPAPNALPKRVFSFGSVALLLQMPIVYFFTGILKNGLEWRHDLTAVWYALKVPDFALPLGVWLTTYPGLLKAMTASTLVLEMAGAILLFCPFRTRTVRFFVILAYFLMQVGLALTLKLGLFPLVSMAALIPFISSSFWDKLFARLRTSERAGLRIFYDADCGFCKKLLRLIQTFFLIPETQTFAAQDDPAIHQKMVRNNSWVVLDYKDREHFKFKALIEVFRVSPLLWPIAPILNLDWLKRLGTRLYELVANSRTVLSRWMSALRYRRISVRQPLLVTLFCALCLAYVIVDNLGTVGRSPVRIPAKLSALGYFSNIHQSWRLFAPSPLRVFTWYVVVGRLKDGHEVDLWTGKEVSWGKPSRDFPWTPNPRWRAYMRYMANDKRKSLRPHFAGYVCRSWNKNRQEGEMVEELSFYRLDEPTDSNEAMQRERKTLLWQQSCLTEDPGSEALDKR